MTKQKTKKKPQKIDSLSIKDTELKNLQNKEASGSYLKEYNFSYDKKVRKFFREKYPEKVEEMRQQILDKYPHLKYNKKYLEYRIDEEILPTVFIRSNTEVSLDSNLSPDMDGLIELQPIKKPSRSKNPRPKNFGPYQKGKYPDMLHDIISDSLDYLTSEERILISKIYGIGEYLDNPVSQSDIAKDMKISQAAISVMKKRILNKLRIALLQEKIDLDGALDE